MSVCLTVCLTVSSLKYLETVRTAAKLHQIFFVHVACSRSRYRMRILQTRLRHQYSVHTGATWQIRLKVRVCQVYGDIMYRCDSTYRFCGLVECPVKFPPPRKIRPSDVALRQNALTICHYCCYYYNNYLKWMRESGAYRPEIKRASRVVVVTSC